MKITIEILTLIVLCIIAIMLYGSIKDNQEAHNIFNVKIEALQQQFNNWITITIE